ncbi:hypothetical protein [Methylobacterium sp. Leaf100]|uniref:hypothetical protein n=1 Tax=Methylobacterium sp. Leaf100 TaxID=1736252 RepID=UPI0012E2BB8C|nr:hypothetical protein [Methylobacterium sp. Leaf100]
MRDIRADLQERLEILAARESEVVREHNRHMRELEQRLENATKSLQEERSAIQSMMAVEMRRHGDDSRIHAPLLPLQDFVVREAFKRGITSKEDLRLAAVKAGYFPDGETGGRQIHTTVLNLTRANRLIEVQDGRYKAPISASPNGPQVEAGVM